MSNNLKNLLKCLQSQRNFNAEKYLKDKIEAINKFFTEEGLDSAVVGLSGGIDSAVVFSLLFKASQVPGSPIKKVLGLSMPIECNGTTNQDEAVRKAKNLYNEILVKDSNYKEFLPLNFSIIDLHKYKTLEFSIVDLSDACGTLTRSYGRRGKSFAIGQLASIVRTPSLYYHAALLQEEGYKSIVVGTTNRDEGSYIGFFGKASDAMVDLQPIADIHKSEVYQIAELLNVTKEIINAVPAGDVHDGRVDEEMIGAPYWFLEMYLLMKNFDFNPFIAFVGVYWLGMDSEKKGIIDESCKKLTKEDKEIYDKYSKAIEEIHAKNKHKYKVGNPDRFIDVMERKIPGGWN